MRRFGIARDDSGVSLLELVIASAILFIAAIGTVTALAFAASATQQSTTRTRALNLANQRLEQARAIPYDNVGVVYEDGSTGDPQGTIPAVETVGNLVITTAVDYLYGVDDRPTYKSRGRIRGRGP
jgi:type II secretory pathway component PulJ